MNNNQSKKDRTKGADKVKVIGRPTLKKRRPDAHKGVFGTALSVCSSYGMVGASILSSRAALRCGLGIMKTACVEENYSAVAAGLPESVLVPCASKDGRYSKEALPTLKKHLKTADALLIGCGLSVSVDTAYIVRELATASKVPVVIDADGINCVADSIEFIKQMKAPLILTPHSAEMARLCGCTVAEVEADREGICRSFAKENGIYLVLKGHRTLVATPDGRLFVNKTGNSGMATGGSGDMLSGMILSFLAQGYTPDKAALFGVRLHGEAGDRAARRKSRTAILPSDMIEELSFLF